jgi:hypothetical protein
MISVLLRARRHLFRRESQLWQALGFLVVTLLQVEILKPTKTPRGQELTVDEKGANQALCHRRRRIENVHSSGKRYRIVKDRMHLWQLGVCDLVMKLCCAWQHFRVRLTP